jgi:hypothetical protein
MSAQDLQKHQLIEKLNDRIELAHHAFANNTKTLSAIEKDIEQIVREADLAGISNLINNESIKVLLLNIQLSKQAGKHETELNASCR